MGRKLRRKVEVQRERERESGDEGMRKKEVAATKRRFHGCHSIPPHSLPPSPNPCHLPHTHLVDVFQKQNLTPSLYAAEEYMWLTGGRASLLATVFAQWRLEEPRGSHNRIRTSSHHSDSYAHKNAVSPPNAQLSRPRPTSHLLHLLICHSKYLKYRFGTGALRRLWFDFPEKYVAQTSKQAADEAQDNKNNRVLSELLQINGFLHLHF